MASLVKIAFGPEPLVIFSVAIVTVFGMYFQLRIAPKTQNPKTPYVESLNLNKNQKR